MSSETARNTQDSIIMRRCSSSYLCSFESRSMGNLYRTIRRSAANTRHRSTLKEASLRDAPLRDAPLSDARSSASPLGGTAATSKVTLWSSSGHTSRKYWAAEETVRSKTFARLDSRGRCGPVTAARMPRPCRLRARPRCERGPAARRICAIKGVYSGEASTLVPVAF